jgi:hypothetical protein
MPGLLVLRRSTHQVEPRRFLAQIIAAVLFVVWEPCCLQAVSAAALRLPSEVLRQLAELLFWLGRELVWWWLISGLAAIALCHLRQLPLVVDTRTTLAGLKRRRRSQMPG